MLIFNKSACKVFFFLSQHKREKFLKQMFSLPSLMKQLNYIFSVTEIKMRKALVLLCVVCALTFVEVSAKEKKLHKDQIKDKDMMRKMIIFNKNNPNFFYCPVPNSKHMTSIDKMIVK